jgi:hypothetical protein
MMQLLVSLLIGICVFASLYLLSRRPSAEGGAESLVRARSALELLQGNLLPAEMVERIFTKADLDYVTEGTTPGVRKLFVEERKRIALLWVNQIAKQIRSLQEFHLGSARFYSRLSAGTEMRLAFEFFTLLCFCRALRLALYLRGPYAAPRMVGRVAAVANSVCATSEQAMSFLNPAKLDRLARNSTRNVTAL